MASAKTTVTFLGTAAVVPAAGHDTASFVINETVLVDTGWYAALKMLQYGLDPLRIQTLILTHCHHDHYLSLPHLLFYRAMRRAKAPGLRPLKIIGPAPDMSVVVELAQRLLRPDKFPEAVCEVDVVALKAGHGCEDAAMKLDTCAARHPVPALCYRFTDKISGATVGFTGDTAPHPSLAAHLRGVGLLITEASYATESAPAEDAWLHSGAPDAARLAAAAGARRLALVHCAEEKQRDALAAAKQIFPNTFWPADGETVTVE